MLDKAFALVYKNQMRNLLYLWSALLLFFAMIAGCGVPGSSGRPAIDDSVTIVAEVNMPSVGANQLLASIARTPEEVLNEFIASSSCEVNNNQVEFALNASDSTLVIKNIPPSSAYEITLRCKDLVLKAFVPWQGRRTFAPYGISARSTADWLIRNAYSIKNKFEMSQLADYKVGTAALDSIETIYSSYLKKNETSVQTLDSVIISAVKDIVAGQDLLQVLSRNTERFNFDGLWKGAVNFYTYNSAGQKALVVYANVEMKFTTYRNTLKGSGKILPVSAALLPGFNSSVPEPYTQNFAFEGSVSDHLIAFNRIEVTGPLAGKILDQWHVFPVRTGVAVKIQPVQTYRGISALPGEFILTQD